MDHLTDWALVDYVRGVVTPEESLRITTHLANCQTCAETAAFYAGVSLASFVPSSPLHEDVVSRARNVFRPPEEWRSSSKHVVARPAFTINGAWALAGVRSAAHLGSAKQGIYQWGDYCVDLRSELQPDTVQVSLIGQIVNQREPLEEFSDVQVRLIVGKKTLAIAACNPLGEFAINFVPRRNMCLEFDLPKPGVSMKVPLKALNPEETKI